MRSKVFAVVVAAMAVIAIGVLPSVAAAESTVVSPLVQTDCPLGFVCAWTGPTFGGERSQWGQAETGCHEHTNRAFESIYNHTSVNVVALEWFGPGGGQFLTLHAGGAQKERGAPDTGAICVE
jgi:Peptidase inhibitor family I36